MLSLPADRFGCVRLEESSSVWFRLAPVEQPCVVTARHNRQLLNWT